jgi:hypothetical protein
MNKFIDLSLFFTFTDTIMKTLMIILLASLSFLASSCLKSPCHANKKHAKRKHAHYNSFQYR